jgi:hypothetical protein
MPPWLVGLEGLGVIIVYLWVMEYYRHRDRRK